MTDPEILDPAGTHDDNNVADAVEALVHAVERALPGKTVRADVQAQRFRLEVEGKGGAVVVESGPLFQVSVSFRGARFFFDMGPMGPGPAKVRARIVDQVKSIANEEVAVLEHQISPRLLRSSVFRIDRDRLVELLDTGIVPHAGDVDEPKLWSFNGTFAGAPSKDQMRAIEKLSGGIVGKLKRKVAEKVMAKVADRIARNFERVVDQAAPRVEVEVDDGRKKLS